MPLIFYFIKIQGCIGIFEEGREKENIKREVQRKFGIFICDFTKQRIPFPWFEREIKVSELINAKKKYIKVKPSMVFIQEEDIFLKNTIIMNDFGGKGENITSTIDECE